jgi:magnesium-transporting ATPase (P-type)
MCYRVPQYVLGSITIGGVGWRHRSVDDRLAVMGDWLYKRYEGHPEIWRVTAQNETNAVVWASLLSFLTCVVFAATCTWLHLHSFSPAFKLAVAMWLVAALPLIIVNTLFMKRGIQAL